MGEAVVTGNKRKYLEVVSPLVANWNIPDLSLKSYLSSRINIGETHPDMRVGGFVW